MSRSRRPGSKISICASSSTTRSTLARNSPPGFGLMSACGEHQRRRWCSPQADIKPKPGGLFRASVDRVVELEAHIDIFEPGRRLRLIYLPSQELPPAEVAIVDDFILDSS